MWNRAIASCFPPRQEDRSAVPLSSGIKMKSVQIASRRLPASSSRPPGFTWRAGRRSHRSEHSSGGPGLGTLGRRVAWLSCGEMHCLSACMPEENLAALFEHQWAMVGDHEKFRNPALINKIKCYEKCTR